MRVQEPKTLLLPSPQARQDNKFEVGKMIDAKTPDAIRKTLNADVKRPASSVQHLLLIVLFLFLAPNAVHALAIAPGQAETSFYPNEQKGFEFELINNDARAANVEVYAKGGLADFVSFASPTKLTMQPRESKRIKFNVNFPNSAKLPDTISIISKTSVKAGGNNAIAANIALEYRLRIVSQQGQQAATGKAVSIPTKADGFSAAEIEIVDVRFENIGKETAKLIIDAKNTGAADIDVSAEVNFGSGTTERFAKAAPIKITGGATRQLVTYVDVRDMPAGSYDAEVLLKYADKVKRQIVKLQIIEAGSFSNPYYVYLIVGALIAFNVVFIALLAGRRRQGES